MRSQHSAPGKPGKNQITEESRREKQEQLRRFIAKWKEGKKRRKSKEERLKQKREKKRILSILPASDAAFRCALGSDVPGCTFPRDSLLSAIMGRAVKTTTVLNPVSRKRGPYEKETRMDILCENEDELFDLEMQTNFPSLDKLEQRAEIHKSIMVTRQRLFGKEYFDMKGVTVVFILRSSENAWPEDCAIRHLVPMYLETNERALMKVSIILVCIPKAGKMVNGKYVDGISCDLRNWCLYFRMNLVLKERVDALGKETVGINEAYKEYAMSYAAPWVQQFERDCYELDKGMRRMYVYETGFSEGEASGEDKMFEKNVLRIFSKGKSAEEIADLLGVPLTNVERCLKKNHKLDG